jgi:His/Glu/Gln/Arg/opine family amino acid ABC transporter permease subunit
VSILDALQSEPFQLYYRALPSAVFNTLLITALSVALGTLLGLGLAIMRLSRIRVVSATARLIIDVGRSVPILVVLYLVYFGILALVFAIPPVAAAILAIGLKLGVYMAELFRSGIRAVPRGQIEAAHALGMSGTRVQRRIVLPIAIRIMLPAIGQYTVGTLLDSSFASVIGAPEITGRSRNIIDLFFTTELWILVAATYVLLAFPMSRLFVQLERRYALSL